jgi:hypothetical protein
VNSSERLNGGTRRAQIRFGRLRGDRTSRADHQTFSSLLDGAPHFCHDGINSPSQQSPDMVDTSDYWTMAALPHLAELRVRRVLRSPIDGVCRVVHELPQHIMTAADVEDIEGDAGRRLQDPKIIRAAERLVFRLTQSVVGGPPSGRVEQAVDPDVKTGPGKTLERDRDRFQGLMHAIGVLPHVLAHDVIRADQPSRHGQWREDGFDEGYLPMQPLFDVSKGF